MKLLTRNTDYAVRAICSMAVKRGRVITVDGLVKELGVPRPFLRKILQILSKEGIVNSLRGAGGGFTLAIKPSKISLTDLIEIFQGPININECVFKKMACPNRSRCPLKVRIDRIERHVETELKSITIESLLNRSGN